MKRVFMNQSQLAEYFGKTNSTIINWEKRGLPVYRPDGAAPLYDLDEVLAWMKQGKATEEKEN